MMNYVIMGLPNVGKSSIFNYLCGSGQNIVYDMPDTTVDYLSYNFSNGVTLTDTCGIHSLSALKNMFSENYYILSDIIIYVVDSRKNNFDQDRIIINSIISTKTVWLVYNFFFEGLILNLPYNKIFYIGKNFDEAKLIKNYLNFQKTNDNNKLAVFIGTSNVGKSTLFNCIVGFKRSKVENAIGTTRDSILEKVDGYDEYTFVDTAGFVNKNEQIDTVVCDARMKIIEKAYCLFIVVDGSVGFSKSDKYILNFAHKYGVFSMLVVNKCDMLCSDFKYQLERINVRLPIIYTSAINNQLGKFFSTLQILLIKAHKDYNKISYIRALNNAIKSTDVFDIKNRKFSLKTLKIIQTNPFVFLYESYFELSNNSQKMLKNLVRKVLKLDGFNINFLHQK